MKRAKAAFTNHSGATRRTLLAGAAFVPLASIISAPKPAARALTAPQRRTLEAFVDRLIPADELGPGAVEAGVVHYIDRCLAGFLAAEQQSIVDGLTAVDAFAKSSQGAVLADLTPERRDTVLSALEGGAIAHGAVFFNRVRRLAMEGMFCDPHWGGNANFAGWDLIRYPGPRLVVAAEDQKLEAETKANRKSAWGVEHDGH